MRTVARLLAAAQLALLAACETATGSGSAAAGGKASAPPPHDWISLERTVSGQSLFVVTLFADGRVFFEGRFADGHRGTLTRVVPVARTQEIFRELDSISFWQLEPRYDVEHVQSGNDNVIGRTAPADAPWEILHASSHGRSKRIDGLFFAPTDLLDFRTHLEKTVGLPDFLAAAAR